MSPETESSPLTPFQLEVARLFFALPSARGWTTTRVRDAATFCRLVVHGATDVLVDLALDSPPVLPPTGSIAGPTFTPAELAARKLLALFDRAEARDFTDVYVLAQRFDREAMLSGAQNLDAGPRPAYLADQLRTLSRFRAGELPIDSSEVLALRDFFSLWRLKLLDGPRT